MLQSPEGNLLMHDVADATESLVPRHNYIPWIVVNKEHTDEIQVSPPPHTLIRNSEKCELIDL